MADSRRGKCYLCLHCLAVGKQYIEVRYRVTAHIFKHHLALDKAPFYCRLCLLRCNTKSALINHVSRYNRHRHAVKELGYPNDSRYLVENPRPAQLILGKDYREILPSESANFVTLQNIDDISDNESEYMQPPPVVTPVSSVMSATPGSGMINVQITPEMLASFFNTQSRQDTVSNSLFKPLPSVSVPGISPSLSQFSAQKYSPSVTSAPLYTPTLTVPSYTPTPIVQKSTVSSSLVNPLPFSLGQNPLSTTGTSAAGTSDLPFIGHQLITTPTGISHKPPQSVLNTPNVSNSTEDILPQLLGENNNNSDSEFDFGFSENWLERQAKCLPSFTSEVLNENPLPASSNTKDVSKQTEHSGETEPVTKKVRMATLDRETRPDTGNQEPSPSTVKAIENIVENSMKQLVDAFERNSHAIKGVDKTLGELMVVMSKMNRTLERMGEEQRREHQRRIEEEEKREKESKSKTDHNNNHKESSSKKKEESRKEGKENKPLKSVVVKK